MIDVPTARPRASERAAQFWLLVVVNVLVGAMVGQERTVLPLLGDEVFGVNPTTIALTTIAAFGASKAVTNLIAGSLSDRFGRRPVLAGGWLLACAVPAVMLWAPAWSWIVAANVLLGVSQGLTWSSTVVMKTDLVAPSRRGFAVGLNEAAGYGGVAAAAVITGLLVPTAGLRGAAFAVGAVAAATGTALSWLTVRETRPAPDPIDAASAAPPRRTPYLPTLALAGMANNVVDGIAWGLLPILFASAGIGVGGIGALVAIYPAVWAVGQLVTGPASDRVGRRPFAVGGLTLQALALVLFAWGDGPGWWAAAATLLGVGTAAAYPTVLAAVTDVAPPARRARVVGRYRFWRDMGFVVGAILAWAIADRFGIRAALVAGAAVAAAIVLHTIWRMPETAPAVRPSAAA